MMLAIQSTAPLLSQNLPDSTESDNIEPRHVKIQTPTIFQLRSDKFRFNFESYYSKFTGYNPLKPSFLVSHPYNSPGWNVNNIYFQYQDGVNDTTGNSDSRISAAISVGDFVTKNQSQEPSIGKNIQEFYYGQKFGNIWVDYGILPSHIGLESALGYDAFNLTRSVQADNSPYYEMGLRVTYEPRNSPWYAAILYLRGWQKMATNSKRRAFGHQLKYTTEHFTINSSSYFGVSPVGDNVNRYFHNLYVQYSLSNNIKFNAGLDVGCDHYLNLKKLNYYWAPIYQIQYKPIDDLAIAGRYEFFYDPNLVLGNLELSKVHGFSVNIDYHYNSSTLYRAEFRQFNLNPMMYYDQNYKLNSFVTVSLILDIQK